MKPQRRESASTVHSPALDAFDMTLEHKPTLTSVQGAADFYQEWLKMQCRTIPGVNAGVLIVATGSAGEYHLVTSSSSKSEQEHLMRASERALTERRTVVLWSRDEIDARKAPEILIAYPFLVEGRTLGAVAIRLSPEPGFDLSRVLQQLHSGWGWIEARAWREEAASFAQRLSRVLTSLVVALVAGEHKRLQPALIALANDLAVRLRCDRVSIGIWERRGLRLRAISNSAAPKAKSQLGDAIENAMDEAMDQNSSVVYPPLQADRRLAIAHRALVRASSAHSVLSVVMSTQGRAIGVITFERRSDEAFTAETLSVCERIAGVIAPLIGLQYDAEQWIAGRIRDETRRGLLTLFGPKRPAAKLAALGAVCLVVFLALATTEYRVSAKAVMEGAVQRAAVAPFDGFIARAPARAGDVVRSGDLLAKLDDRDLLLEEARWRSELEKVRQKYYEALSKRDRPAVTGLIIQLKQAQSQLSFVEEKLARTSVTAPFDGIVVSGDLTQLLGSPIDKGKTLFEVAPLEAYRVIAQVDERDFRHITVGQTGRLMLTGLPRHALPLTVTTITPVSSAEDGRNFFRVEADLAQTSLPLRPGMEGVAKIEVGSRSLIWVWTHSLCDWLRLAAWNWLP